MTEMTAQQNTKKILRNFHTLIEAASQDIKTCENTDAIKKRMQKLAEALQTSVDNDMALLKQQQLADLILIYINICLDALDQVVLTPLRNLQVWGDLFFKQHGISRDYFMSAFPHHLGNDLLIVPGVAVPTIGFYEWDAYCDRLEKAHTTSHNYALDKLLQDNRNLISKEAIKTKLDRQKALSILDGLLLTLNRVEEIFNAEAKQEKKSRFVRAVKWLTQNPASRFLTPFVKWMIHYSMMYWVVSMIAAIFTGVMGITVGFAVGGIMITGSLLTFLIAATGVALYYAIKVGQKIYNTYKNPPSSEQNTTQIAELAGKESENIAQQQVAMFYIETQADLIKEQLELSSVKLPPATQVIQSVPSVQGEPEAIQALDNRATQKRAIIFATVLGGLSGYVLTQFFFAPILDGITVLLGFFDVVLPGAGLIANLINFSIFGISCLAGVAYGAHFGVKQQERFTDFRSTIDKLREAKAEEASQLNTVNQLRADILALRQKLDTRLDEETKNALAKLPHYDNAIFFETLDVKPSWSKTIRGVLGILFEGINGWGSGMFIIRSTLFIFALFLTMSNPVLLGLLVGGFVLSVVMGVAKAYSKYQERDFSRHEQFLRQIDVRKTCLSVEKDILSRLEIKLNNTGSEQTQATSEKQHFCLDPVHGRNGESSKTYLTDGERIDIPQSKEG